MTRAAIDSSLVRQMVDRAELVARLARTIATSPDPGTSTVDSYVAAVRAAKEQAEALRSSNPVPDPATLRALADDALHAYEQARAYSQFQTSLDLGTVEAMAEQARQAYEEVQKFLHSARLPPPAAREELARRHLELLDELDREYGPPSDQDATEARRALDELRWTE